jgi:hypothetical protein
VHAATDDKCNDTKDSLCEELQRVLDKFPKYHTKIFLQDFSAKVRREDIFKLTFGSKSITNSLTYSMEQSPS